MRQQERTEDSERKVMSNAFEELERNLPNGFHDAELLGIHVDYVKAEVSITLLVDMGDPDVPTGATERPANVVFSGVKLFAVEAARNSGGLAASTVTSGPGQPRTKKDNERLPDGCFQAWFFLTKFNSFVQITATDVRFEWVEGTPE
jgi:hypothetical protein